MKNLPFGDDPAADCSAQREQNQVVHIAPRARSLFAQGRGIGIVLQNDVRDPPEHDFESAHPASCRATGSVHGLLCYGPEALGRKSLMHGDTL